MDSENRRFTPPWILLAVLALGGVAVYGKKPPIETDRPQTAPLGDGVAQSPPAVAARRWEDPLRAPIDHWKGKEDAPAKDPALTLQSVRDTLEKAGDSCLFLPVFLDSGPYPESQESRLRTRYAVLSALSFAGYGPGDGDVLRYFVVKARVEDLRTEDRVIVVPYELFKSSDARTNRDEPGSILVLWLAEGLLGQRPIATIRAILRDMQGPADKERDVALIGPTSSGTLVTIARETTQMTDMFRRWVLYSDRATVTKYLGQVSKAAIRSAVWTTMEQRGPQGVEMTPALRIVRTIGTDDALATALVQELEHRHVFPADSKSRTVILSEWDSLYALNWREALELAILKRDADRRGVKVDPDAGMPENVYSYTYLRGVDGKGPAPDAKQPNDRPEGFAQIDYVRRIDAQLAALQDQVGRITAIGVMGSDLYDKIVLLKALRKTFPEAVFFTSDLDARYLHAEEWDWAHNLVVASHFGLSLDPAYQKSTPPFRDCYQTSTYLATLKAIQYPCLKETDPSKPDPPPGPLIFEVGRDGASPLVRPPANSVHPPLSQGKHTLGPLLAFVSFLVAVLIVFLFLLRHSIRHDAMPGAYDRALWWSLALCLALLGSLTVVIAIDSQRADGGEPFSVAGGISVWPTELVRVLVIGLSVAAFYLLPRALQDNRVRLEVEFPSLASAQSGVGAAWSRYVGSSKGWPLVKRLGCWAAPYVVAVLVFLGEDALPRRPIRGDVANVVDWCFSGFGVALLNLLLWGVTDAMLMCRRWVADLMREALQWPEGDRKTAVAGPGALTASADRMLSLRLIAGRTEMVGRLVFYPFLLTTLLVLARTEIFDAWTWNLPLAMFFGSLAVICLSTVLMLRRAAERARAAALEQVQRDRLTATSDEVRSSLEEIERQIASLRRGAFVPLQENPVVASLLIPFSGIGAVEVLKFWL